MPKLPPLPPTVIEPMVRRALDEDFGNSGDLTANLLVPASAKGKLVMRAREAGVIAGMQAAQMTYAMVDPRVKFTVKKGDGSKVKKGDIIATVLTSQYVTLVKGTNVRIAATRKTTPGLRAVEKQAVLAGGGFTHRESLAAAIMIKDNHIALAGGVDKALKTIARNADHMAKVSVEVDTLAQLKKVLKYAPDVVLLDNMGAEKLIKAVAIVDAFDGPRPTLEASGGVNLETVKGLAQTGIDVISIGALTHSAPNFDIGMDAA